MLYSSINFVCAFIFIAFTSNFIMGLLYPLWRKAFKANANHIFTLSLLPFIIAMVSCLLISLKITILAFSQHCHGTNCQAHIPHINIDQADNQLFIFLLAAAALCYLCVALFRNYLSSYRLKQLQQFGQQQKENYQTLDTNELLAFSSGLFKPKTFISTGLMAQLSKEQLNAVILHEQAHNLHKDNLRKNSIYWFSQLWLPKAKQLIREDFMLQCEYNSDRYAAYNPSAKQALLGALDVILNAKQKPIYERRIQHIKQPQSYTHTLLFAAFNLVSGLCLLIALMAAYHYLAELLLN